MPGRTFRIAAVTALVASAASVGLVSGAAAATSPVGSARRHADEHHRSHRHRRDECDESPTEARTVTRRGDDCGPPPTVPEVPLNLLLPLSGAAVVGAVVVVRRRVRATGSGAGTPDGPAGGRLRRGST